MALAGLLALGLASLTLPPSADAAAPPKPVRKLFPFEAVSNQILLPGDRAEILRAIGFERITGLMENNQTVEALNDAYMMAIRRPELWETPEFKLLLAELYFRLGIERPRIQFEIAKPLYEELMRRNPQWENQPLVAYRLATLYDRLGLSTDALAHYGLLIDWYPDDPLADKARLGIVLTNLREGQLRDTEALARAVLSKSSDALVRYHAALCLAVAYHRQGRTPEAAEIFSRTVNWPEDLGLLLDYELFAFAEAMLRTGQAQRAREGLIAYLRQHADGDDRPFAVLYLADMARQQGEYEDAVAGYQHLIDRFPSTRAGVTARLNMAGLRLEAVKDGEEQTAERLLLFAYDQNNFLDLAQEAALQLAEYYLRADQPLKAAGLAAAVRDKPLDLAASARAVSVIAVAFARIVEAADDPMVPAAFFDKFRKHLSLASLPEAVYQRFGDQLYENFQADTLADLAAKGPLANRFPRLSVLEAARAELLRGDQPAAIAAFEKLMKLPESRPAAESAAGAKIGAAAKRGKPATRRAAPLSAKTQPDPLRLAARLLWAQTLLDERRPRDALQQIALARHDASDKMDEARLEAAAGRALLADGASGAAAERLSNALRLYGGAETEPWRSQRAQVTFTLGEALFFAQRYGDAEKLFAELLQQKLEEPHASMARLRVAMLLRARGERLPDLPGHRAGDAPPTDFWPGAAWAVEEHLLWRQKNEKRFGDEPVWEDLP